MSPHHRFQLVLALSLSALAAAGCASNHVHEDPTSIGSLIAHGHYERAVQLAADRHEARPDDPEVDRDWRIATVALLMERGRRATFADRDVEALEFFDQALAIGSDVTQIQPWIDATLDKLAERWGEMATEWHAQDNLDQAVECYEKALSFRPEYTFAREGLSHALLQQNHRDGMSQSYYEDGVHSLDEYWLEEAAHDFSASLKYRDDHERAVRRRTQTNTLRADDRAALALNLEGAGQWAAARNEYRIATLLDANHVDANAGLERMKREEKAANLLREAARLRMHKQFDRAQAELDEAAALTERQVDDVEAARQDLAKARLQQKYDSALALENDFRFEDAIAAYDELLKEVAGFEDAIARRDTLIDFVGKAERHYAEALATDDPAAQLEALRQVMIVYPEYKDTRARVEALEAELGPQASKQPR